MRLDVHRPRGWLTPFVDHYWRVSVTPAEYPFSREILLPDGGVTVIFNLGDPQTLGEAGDERLFTRSWVAGERTRPITLGAPGTTELVGIHFRPGGAHPFFSAPIGEVTDEVVDLDLAWAADAELTRERLAASPAMADIVETLDALLAAQAHRRRPDRSVIAAVAALGRGSDDCLTVRALAADIGVTDRTLRRRFNDWVGFGPKMLQRLLRFVEVLRFEARSGDRDWAEIAYSCGYCDQSHLIGEFREFSGVTPTEYLARRGVLPGYMPIEARDGSLDRERAERLQSEILEGRDPLELSLGP